MSVSHVGGMEFVHYNQIVGSNHFQDATYYYILWKNLAFFLSLAVLFLQAVLFVFLFCINATTIDYVYN